MQDILCADKLHASLAVIAENASVKLHNMSASCLLMKTVDILRDNTLQFSGIFQFRQLDMRDIWLRIQAKHLIPIETVKLLRSSAVEAVA